MYDKVTEERQQLPKFPDIEEEAIEELFEFTRLVICGDKVSRTAQAAKWKAMKKKSFIRLPRERQLCTTAV